MHPFIPRSLLVLPFLAVSLLAIEPIPEGKHRIVGGYLLNNNVWGKDKSPKGWEVIENIHFERKTLDWTVRYDWPVGTDKYAVKCYPSVVTGWQWGLWSTDGRLPRTVSTLKRVTTGATAKTVNPGVQNAAYDLWFHPAGPKPEGQVKPSDELMIWMASHGGAGPLGKLHEKVTIGGVEWALYIGDIGWKVFSFIRPKNASSWEIDANAFIQHLVKAGHLAPDKQLTSVQFGTEVFQSPGEGKFVVDDYFVEIE